MAYHADASLARVEHALHVNVKGLVPVPITCGFKGTMEYPAGGRERWKEGGRGRREGGRRERREEGKGKKI